MIIQRVEQADWLSNAYLVVDEPGGTGVLVDSNAVTDPLVERAEREGTEITHVLLTHHHYDHVVGFEKLAERFDAPVLAHEKTAAELGEGKVAETLADGDVIEAGGLRIEALHTPGHCADHLALLLDGQDCLTGDVLFRGTVGGTRAPGATGFSDLRASVERLMELAPEVRIHPGHRGPSTIGEERERNPFVRIWRGLDAEGAEPCSIGPADATEREPATLVLWAPDYDGGNKAWVRFESGEQAIVGGSQVRRER